VLSNKQINIIDALAESLETLKLILLVHTKMFSACHRCLEIENEIVLSMRVK